MASTVTHTCDRCGVEYDGRSSIKFYYLHVQTHEFDLCDNCFRLLMDFLKG